MKRIHRKMDSISFSAGQTKTSEIPKEFILTGIHLYCEGQITVTSALTLLDEVPERLLRRIEIVADGEVLQSWTGELLRFFDYAISRRFPLRQPPGTSVATHPMKCHLFLPFRLGWTNTPGISYFDPSRYRNVQLRVTFGTTADLYSAGTATIDSFTVYPVTRELMASAAQLSQAGRFADFVTNHSQYAISGAVTDQIIQLPREHDVLGIIVRQGDSSMPANLAEAVTNLKVQERKTLITYDWSDEIARAIQDWDLQPVEDYETPPTGEGRIESYFWIDFMERGVVDRVRPQAWNSFDLLVSTSGAVQLDVLALQLRG